MKKNSLYIAGICAALSVGALGCASSAKAGDEETKPVVEDTEAAGEATAAETICVYGPVSEVTSDSVTIDNQSGISSAGEMVITFSPETPIFDAETGNPVDMTEAETGTVVYAYIGDAMAMSNHERTALLRPCNQCERRAGLHGDRVGEKECRE